MNTTLPGPLAASSRNNSPSVTMKNSSVSWLCTGSVWPGPYSTNCTGGTPGTLRVSAFTRIAGSYSNHGTSCSLMRKIAVTSLPFRARGAPDVVVEGAVVKPARELAREPHWTGKRDSTGVARLAPRRATHVPAVQLAQVAGDD